MVHAFVVPFVVLQFPTMPMLTNLFVVYRFSAIMARNEEKAQGMMNRWTQMKEDMAKRDRG